MSRVQSGGPGDASRRATGYAALPIPSHLYRPTAALPVRTAQRPGTTTGVAQSGEGRWPITVPRSSGLWRDDRGCPRPARPHQTATTRPARLSLSPINLFDHPLGRCVSPRRGHRPPPERRPFNLAQPNVRATRSTRNQRIKHRADRKPLDQVGEVVERLIWARALLALRRRCPLSPGEAHACTAPIRRANASGTVNPYAALNSSRVGGWSRSLGTPRA